MGIEDIKELLLQRITSNNNNGEEMNEKNNLERADEFFAIASELQEILSIIEQN